LFVIVDAAAQVALRSSQVLDDRGAPYIGLSPCLAGLVPVVELQGGQDADHHDANLQENREPVTVTQLQG
jgi:hypothetical protein